MMPETIQVMTTTDKEEDAARIARSLVEAHLAACVQVIGPMTSIYRWQGQIETVREWICLVKTRLELFPELERAIKALHPYEIPEILALPVLAGSPDYVQWLCAETDREGGSPDRPNPGGSSSLDP